MIDAGDAFVEPAADRFHVANAAAELDRHFHRAENFLDRQRIHRLAGESAVEVDDMQMVEALVVEGAAPARPDRR